MTDLGELNKKTAEVIERARETNFGLMTTVVGLSASAIGLCVVSGKLPAIFAVLFDLPILFSLAQQWCIREAREKEVEGQAYSNIIGLVDAFPELKKDPDAIKSVGAAAKAMMNTGTHSTRWFLYANRFCTAGVITFGLTSLAAVIWFAANPEVHPYIP